jgi:ADP-heptose:LPS heptosyltransferase
MTRRNGAARPRVLVLRALGLGDFLTGLPALRAVAAAFPEHATVLAAPATLAPLAELCGAVDELVDAAPLARLRPSADGADLGVNLHGKGPESHRVLQAARPARLVAFAHPEISGSEGWPEWRPDEHEVDRWCRLLAESGIPADPSDLRLPPPAGVDLPTGAVPGATVVHPGAASGARRWPIRRWAEVARAQAASGHTVLVTGSKAERPLAEAVARLAGLPEGGVLAGRTDLRELAAVIASAGAVACGDTGVAHLATAFGTPSVVLFGPTSPEEWGPPRTASFHRVLWAGHRGDPHGADPDQGLLRIPTSAVLETLSGLEAVRSRSISAPHTGAPVPEGGMP